MPQRPGHPAARLNAVTKKIKRIAAGFQNFTHDHPRMLLPTGGRYRPDLGT